MSDELRLAFAIGFLFNMTCCYSMFRRGLLLRDIAMVVPGLLLGFISGFMAGFQLVKVFNL